MTYAANRCAAGTMAADTKAAAQLFQGTFGTTNMHTAIQAATNVEPRTGLSQACAFSIAAMAKAPLISKSSPKSSTVCGRTARDRCKAARPMDDRTENSALSRNTELW